MCYLVGLYYEPGSLKAQLCRDGRSQLYKYCKLRGVPHMQMGKLIVACTDHEVEKLRCNYGSQHWLNARLCSRTLA